MTEERLQQLIKACIKQDRLSQKELYKAYYAYAMAIAIRYAGNRYEAAEIMNEGFFKVFTHISEYNPEKPFKTWIARIMTNASIDYYRANLKTQRLDDLEKAGHIQDEATIVGKLVYQDILAFIQELPPAYRTVFNLFVVDGYTHEEIAGMLDISVGTSKSNLHKARQKLQEMILEHSKSAARSYPADGREYRDVPFSSPSLRITDLMNPNFWQR